MNSRHRTRCRKREEKSERLFGVKINPLAIATIHRLLQRTMESIRPIPDTVSPAVAFLSSIRAQTQQSVRL